MASAIRCRSRRTGRLDMRWSIHRLCSGVLSVRAYFKAGFHSVQACNPPHLIFIVAAFWKYLFGNHGVNPELYKAKFGRRGLFWRLLRRFERMTFAMADMSLATNDTFKAIAVEREGMAADDVYVVRSIPNVMKLKRLAPSPELRNGRACVIGHVGITGAQDGVDLFIDVMAELVNVQGRQDIQAVIVGSGTKLAACAGGRAARRGGGRVTSLSRPTRRGGAH
jgi:hypothetical protein